MVDVLRSPSHRCELCATNPASAASECRVDLARSRSVRPEPVPWALCSRLARARKARSRSAFTPAYFWMLDFLRHVLYVRWEAWGCCSASPQDS